MSYVGRYFGRDGGGSGNGIIASVFWSTTMRAATKRDLTGGVMNSVDTALTDLTKL